MPSFNVPLQLTAWDWLTVERAAPAVAANAAATSVASA